LIFNTKHIRILLLLLVLLVVFFIVDISLGSINIPFSDVFSSFFTSDGSVTEVIIKNYRLPKAITAILVGIGLSISGLLMQTLFRNPLAGPYILGVSSGASLGVALVILGSSLLPIYIQNLIQNSFGIAFAAAFGSFLVLLIILLVAQKIKDSMLVLIVGVMFGSFTNAFVNFLSYFGKAEELQKYIVWNMGSLANLSWETILVLAFIVFIGFGASLWLSKTLNSLLLGENYAQSVGILLKKERLKIILITGVLTGSITAFVGPIAFVGLAVPHLAKLIFKTSNHFILVISSSLVGAIILVLCDFLSQNIFKNTLIPINVLTSLLGVPVILYIIFNKQKIKF
jgi:iron complex transport system permease protein